MSPAKWDDHRRRGDSAPKEENYTIAFLAAISRILAQPFFTVVPAVRVTVVFTLASVVGSR
jgi:hypothetical protein